MPAQRLVSSLGDAAKEAAQCFTLLEIEDATKKFERKVGSGGFGVVYYGKLKDGKEIAVKVLTSNSYQGKREFTNEVSFLVIQSFQCFLCLLFFGCLILTVLHMLIMYVCSYL